jgi:hypothetical protein
MFNKKPFFHKWQGITIAIVSIGFALIMAIKIEVTEQHFIINRIFFSLPVLAIIPCVVMTAVMTLVKA